MQNFLGPAPRHLHDLRLPCFWMAGRRGIHWWRERCRQRTNRGRLVEHALLRLDRSSMSPFGGGKPGLGERGPITQTPPVVPEDGRHDYS